MKKLSLRILSFLALLMSLQFQSNCQSTSYDPTYPFSAEELKADFRFLRSKLEKRHPNLYLYNDPATLNLFFDSLENQLIHPATEREFYHLLSLLNSRIKDGHTMILPSEKATTYYNSIESFFPFFLQIRPDSAIVRMNCSNDSSIPAGALIKSINHVPLRLLLNDLINRQVRDGENLTYPCWILTNYFKEYYSFSFGHPASYDLVYQLSDGKETSVTVKALKKDSINYFKRLRYPSAVPVNETGKGITLQIDTTLSTATLSIKSFDNSLLKNRYQQSFKSTLQNDIEKITDSKVTNLILDLRDNQGGDFEPGRQLLSYLIREPMIYLEGSPQQRTLYPATNSFQGKLFVLINGGSFSNSGIVTAYLRMQKRALFFGEESAGNSTILSGDPIDVYLPNTKLYCQVSTTSYIINSKERDRHGTIPQYYILPTITSVLAGKDEIMDAVLKVIRGL